jgi:hypothetical protein
MANVEDLGAAPPARRWRTFGALAVNLIPVIGVAFWDWNAGVLLLLYWFENVAIGVFNALRMADRRDGRGRDLAGQPVPDPVLRVPLRHILSRAWRVRLDNVRAGLGAYRGAERSAGHAAFHRRDLGQ